MKYSELTKIVAEETLLPEEVVKAAYVSFWKFITSTASSLPLKEDLSEEEFKELRTNFNIPGIGKLFCTYDRYVAVKNRFKIAKSIKEHDNYKECETDV